MKRWKKVLLSAVAFVVLLILAGLLLPSHRRIERSIPLRVEAQDVFNMITTLRRWSEWTAWTTNRFPDMTIRFEGPESGVGATMIAAGKSSGDGVVKTIEADAASGIGYTLDFNHGLQLFTGAIRYTNLPDGLRVNWTLDADLGASPFKRWAGLAMESLMSGDMEQGLANLKRTVEEKR